MLETQNGGLGTEQIVLIAAVGGALVLIAMVFTVLLLAVCVYRKKSK